DVIKAWQFNSASKTFNTTPVMQGTTLNEVGEGNLAAMSLSANGSQAGSGIVWAARPNCPAGSTSCNATEGTEPGILTAYDAGNLAHELWNSNQNSTRDALDGYAKFNPPTIANGKVYVASFVGPSTPKPGEESGK